MARTATVEVKLTEVPRVKALGADLERKVAAYRSVLADRERELLELKGPCSTCRLHYAHSGPCDKP